MKTFLWCIVPLLTAVHCTIVEIPNGKLQGSYNGAYYTFTNIPYAQPPTGAYRFEAPLPFTTKWNDIKNATSTSVSCVQDEDCLVLNIFTPNVSPKRRYTVRVFIYGGGFMIGDAGGIAEQYIVRQNVVLAIPNYRVGAFGFLSSGTDSVSGNFGLKDQQLALKWVHENIHAFGGDATKVHLTGVSAGGASVHFHLLNPSSWKYFNGAMSSSGNALNRWTMQPNPKEQFKKYIKHLGCDLPNPDDVKLCLQDRTKEEHSAATIALTEFNDNPFNVFGVVEESKMVVNPFLTEHPRTLIKKGQISKAPWVLGYSLREGSFTASEFMSYDEHGRELVEILNSRWREIAPIVLFYNNSCVGCSKVKASQYRDAYSDYLKQTYMKGKKFSAKTYPLLEKMFTDVLFMDGIKEAISLHALYGKAPVYAYDYRNPLEFGIGNVLSMRLDLHFGADHGADMQYVLPLKDLMLPDDIYTSNDQFIAENMIKMGQELSISGIAWYDSKRLPINNASQTGKLTIYETYYTIETCTNDGVCTKEIYKNPV